MTLVMSFVTAEKKKHENEKTTSTKKIEQEGKLG